MGEVRLGLTAFAVGCLLMTLPQGAQAMGGAPVALSSMTPPLVRDAAGLGLFHHGRRTQEVYCLRRNYWWFYRPYTTAPENYPRCEPYFHYLEPYSGRRGAQSDPYFK